MIHFPDEKEELEGCISLNFNRFLNNLSLNIKFSAFLLCLGFNWGFETLLKKFNKVILFWNTISIKL